jgi:hypothetical protein
MKFAVSLMATEATDAEGRVLERGGEIDLRSRSAGRAAQRSRLIAEGQLIAVASPDKQASRPGDGRRTSACVRSPGHDDPGRRR